MQEKQNYQIDSSKKMNKQAKTIEILKCEIEELQNTINKQNYTIREQNVTIEEHESTIDGQKHMINEQNFTINEQNDTIEDRKNTIDDQKHTINNYEQTIDKLTRAQNTGDEKTNDSHETNDGKTNDSHESNAEKGKIGELIVMKVLHKAFPGGNIEFENVANKSNSGDIQMTIYTKSGHKYKGIIDAKNYKENGFVCQKTITKLKRDVDKGECLFGIIAGINKTIFCGGKPLFAIDKTRKNRRIMYISDVGKTNELLYAAIRLMMAYTEFDIETSGDGREAKINKEYVEKYHDVHESAVEHMHKAISHIDCAKSISENYKRSVDNRYAHL